MVAPLRARPLALALLLAALALPLFSGCGPSFRTLGFHRSYSDLEFADWDSDLAHAVDRPQGPDVRCDGIYLPPVLVRADVLPKHPNLRDHIAEILQKRVYYHLKVRWKDEGLQVSSTPPDTATLALAGKRAYELEIAITDAKRGLGVLRWLVGFYAGASHLQVEGTLRSLPDREILARYTCRVVFSGQSHMGLNPRALSTRYCLRVSSDWAAYDIAALPGFVFDTFPNPLEEEAEEAE